MALHEYVPGSRWTLVVRGPLAAVVPAGEDDELVADLWDALGAEGAGLYAALDPLARRFGLSGMPPFAMMEVGTRLRVLVRGEVPVAVAGPEGSEALDGTGSGTWLERSFPAWDTAEVGDALGAAPVQTPSGARTRPRLPLVGGVVGADSLVVRAAHDGAAAPSIVAAPQASLAQASSPLGPPAASASEETLLPPPDATVAHGGLAAAPPVQNEPVQNEPVQNEPAQNEPVQNEPVQKSPAQRSPGQDDAAQAAPTVPAPEEEASALYDELWGTTVLRSVEDAAIRAVADEVTAPEAAGPPESGPPESGSPENAAPEDASSAAVPAAVVVPARVAESGWTPPSLLIDEPRHSVPPRNAWQDGIGGGGHPADSRRSITSELFEDHDGETVMRSSLDPADVGSAQPRLSGPGTPQDPGQPGHGPASQNPASQNSASQNPISQATLVLGRRCAAHGHANPPSNAQCAACGERLEGEPEQIPRPALGRAVLSTGEVIELVEPLIVGRQPSVSRVPSGGMPRLVSVSGPAGDISRNHLEVRLEGWHVMLRDLKATNGTVLERRGQAPRRLAQGEMVIVLDGDVADLGDGISLRFEAVP